MKSSIHFSKEGLITLIFVFSSIMVFSQEQDSLLKKQDSTIVNMALAKSADRFPMARLLNIEYSQVTPYKFTSKFKDTDLPDGKVNSLYQLRASANINFIKKKKWILGTTFNYLYLSTESEGTNFFENSTSLNSYKEDFHFHSTSLNLTHFSKLFNKTIVYSGSANVNGSDKGFERLTGMLTAKSNTPNKNDDRNGWND